MYGPEGQAWDLGKMIFLLFTRATEKGIELALSLCPPSRCANPNAQMIMPKQSKQTNKKNNQSYLQILQQSDVQWEQPSTCI